LADVPGFEYMRDAKWEKYQAESEISSPESLKTISDSPTIASEDLESPPTSFADWQSVVIKGVYGKCLPNQERNNWKNIGHEFVANGLVDLDNDAHSFSSDVVETRDEIQHPRLLDGQPGLKSLVPSDNLDSLSEDSGDDGDCEDDSEDDSDDESDGDSYEETDDDEDDDEDSKDDEYDDDVESESDYDEEETEEDVGNSPQSPSLFSSDEETH
jgi:hypothetical protein